MTVIKRLRKRPLLAVSIAFLGVAIGLLPVADLTIYPSSPWQELARIGRGLLTPQWHDSQTLILAIARTLAFALLGVALSASLGLIVAFFYRWRLIRLSCASVRAVHELFWALIFMQVLGLNPLTGILAIAIPYTGMFARVFSEILDQQSALPAETLSNEYGISQWVYARFCQAIPQLRSYTRYRFECALRSSTILGFIGLPTLGFYFETAFKQGQYAEAACLLWCFFLLIASLRLWLHWRLVPLYLLAAGFLLPDAQAVNSSYLWQFISRDIWPMELLRGDWLGALQWYGHELTTTLLPAAAYTLVLSLVALVATGLLTLIIYPLASRPFVGRGQFLGHGLLLFFRSTPEFMLAFVFLLIFGPSALPAIIALTIHNSGLIAYLTARNTDLLQFRADAPTGLNLYCYETTPRLYSGLCAFLLYRWEVIMRESAILGLLGVTTLGFYVDSAFEEIRYDKAFLLVVVAAILNVGVDSVSRRLRDFCRLDDQARPLINR